MCLCAHLCWRGWVGKVDWGLVLKVTGLAKMDMKVDIRRAQIGFGIGREKE